MAVLHYVSSVWDALHFNKRIPSPFSPSWCSENSVTEGFWTFPRITFQVKYSLTCAFPILYSRILSLVQILSPCSWRADFRQLSCDFIGFLSPKIVRLPFTTTGQLLWEFSRASLLTWLIPWFVSQWYKTSNIVHCQAR